MDATEYQLREMIAELQRKLDRVIAVLMEKNIVEYSDIEGDE